MENDRIITAAVTSAIGGLVLGILFAPDKGSKTRKKLFGKGGDYLRSIKKTSGEMQNQKSKAEAAAEEINTLGGSIKTRQGEQDYAELTKKELYEHARDAGVRGFSQMNKAELIEALKNR